MTTKVLRICQVFAFGFFVSSIAAQDLDRTFMVAPGGKLVVEAERGSVEVISGETDRVIIEIDPRQMDVGEFFDDYSVSFDQNGDRIEVKIELKRSVNRWFNWGNKGFVLRAEVPFRFDVDLTTSGGSISVEDLEGQVESETSGGSLSFGSIHGTVNGQTSGGSIDLKECSGDIDLTTSGGGITVGDVDGMITARTSGGSISIDKATGFVDASTSGGGISVKDALGGIKAETSGGSVSAVISRQPEDDCYLKTSGGSVTVEIASGLNFRVDAAASGGRVSSELDISGSKSKSEVRGTLNSGGPELTLRTSGGGVYIKQL